MDIHAGFPFPPGPEPGQDLVLFNDDKGGIGTVIHPGVSLGMRVGVAAEFGIYHKKSGDLVDRFLPFGDEYVFDKPVLAVTVLYGLTNPVPAQPVDDIQPAQNHIHQLRIYKGAVFHSGNKIRPGFHIFFSKSDGHIPVIGSACDNGLTVLRILHDGPLRQNVSHGTNLTPVHLLALKIRSYSSIGKWICSA
jgi:hypothetical protein